MIRTAAVGGLFYCLRVIRIICILRVMTLRRVKGVLSTYIPALHTQHISSAASHLGNLNTEV